MKSKNKCESCGMPLKQDSQGRGSNSDGSINARYCSYCYQNGQFTYTGTDVKGFQEFCRQKMIEGGHNKFTSWLFTRGYSRLPRWKKIKI